MGVISRIRPHVLNRFGAETVEIPSWLRSSLVGYWSGGHRDNVYYPLPMKNEVYYTPSTWAEWNVTNYTIAINNGYLSVANQTGNSNISLPTNLKPSQKYGILINVRSNTRTTSFSALAVASSYPFQTTKDIKAGQAGNFKFTDTTKASFTLNKYYQYAPMDAGTIEYGDLRVLELPAGSTIESDFTNLTADQLAVKYPFGNIETIFGSGNAPTKAEMDLMYAADGTAHWDGTRNVLCNPNGKYFWADYSGNGRHSKANNMAWTTSSGWDGYLLVHDGTDDYTRRTLSAAIADGSSYSYSLTVKSVANKAIANLHTTTTVAMIMGLDANGYAYVTVFDTAANAYTVTDNTNKAGILTRITAVVDIAAMKLYLYVNGVSRGTPATLANTIRGFITASVGTNAATNAYTALSLGMGVQVSRALTATEEAQLYNANKRRFNI